MRQSLNSLNSLKEFDFVFNTVPYPIIDSKLLKTAKEDCVFIELASYPYGIDINFAENKIKAACNGSN